MQERKINISNNQSEKIETKELKIHKNVFIYNETVIPLSNISRISVAVAPKRSYSPWTFIAALIGFMLLFSETGTGVLIGLLFIGGASLIIYTTYQENKDLHEYLVLNLNSGKDIYLYSKNHQFTIRVMDVIINCLNSGNEYKINMENCHIEACQFGNENIIQG